MILVAVATLIGASVASTTGFGFALILSPVMFETLEPDAAVTTLLVLGLGLNLLILFGSGGRPGAIRWRAVSPLLAASLPGLAGGVLLLALMPKPVLQIAVGLAVIGAAITQARQTAGRVAAEGTADRAAAAHAARPVEPVGPAVARDENLESRLASACAVGLVTGALTTSTTVSGPPLVLWLQAQRMPHEEFRASLAACFLGLTVAGGAVLAASGMLSLDAGVVLPLLGLTVLGQMLGARALRGLDAVHLRSAVLALVLIAGVGSLAAGIIGAR